MSHQAVRLYVGPLHGDGDAIEENEKQNHVVEQFVRNHSLATWTKPKDKEGERDLSKDWTQKQNILEK